MADRHWYSRLLRIEPGVSFGQWVYDRITSNWDRLVAVFVAGGGMTYLASITEWVGAWGPVGIGAIGLLAALIVWVGLAWAASLRAKAHTRRAGAKAIEQWSRASDRINPLETTFRNQRIRITDLVSPIENVVRDKTFINCELLGPANIGWANSPMNKIRPVKVDAVVFKDGAEPANIIYFYNCNIVGGILYNVTVMVNEQNYPPIKSQLGHANWLSADPEKKEPPSDESKSD